jgi:aminoglycoside phosphotransferase (APT) family kinase protein
MPLTLDEVITRVPEWKDAKELKSIPLGGGITSSKFYIDIRGEPFVIRLPGEDTQLLGINRDYEFAANQAAGVLSISPEVHYSIQPKVI